MGLESVVSYWKLDEASGQRNDFISTNHLTVSGTVSSGAGKILNAVSGTGSLSKSSPANGLGDSRTQWALSFWIKPVAGGVTTITSVGGTSTTTVTIIANGKEIRYGYSWSNGGSGGLEFFDGLTEGVWHHVLIQSYEYPNFATNEMFYRVRVTVDNSESLVVGTFPSSGMANASSGVTSFTLASGANFLDEVGWFSDSLRDVNSPLLWNNGAGNSCPFIVPLTLNNLNGTATVSFVPAHTKAVGFSSAGTSVVSMPLTALKETAFESIASSAASFDAKALTETGFGSSGTSTVDFQAVSNAATGFSISGTSIVEFDSEKSTASGFSISAISSVGFTVESVAETAFILTGTSDCVGTPQGSQETAFSISGTSTVDFQSTPLSVSTTVQGSNGAAVEKVVLDWSVCDVATITLVAQEQTRIFHNKLIPGKLLRVAIVNNNSPGSVDWDSGEAVVDWGLSGLPDVPGNGETLWLEFFAVSRTEVKGRLYFSNTGNSQFSESQWYCDSTEDGTLVGLVDSGNDTFVLSHLPSSRSIVQVKMNGVDVRKGSFSRNGTVVVLSAENIPHEGEEISAIYCQ